MTLNTLGFMLDTRDGRKDFSSHNVSPLHPLESSHSVHFSNLGQFLFPFLGVWHIGNVVHKTYVGWLTGPANYVLYFPDYSCLKLNCDGGLGPPTDPVKQEGEVFVLPGSVGLASCQSVWY